MFAGVELFLEFEEIELRNPRWVCASDEIFWTWIIKICFCSNLSNKYLLKCVRIISRPVGKRGTSSINEPCLNDISNLVIFQIRTYVIRTYVIIKRFAWVIIVIYAYSSFFVWWWFEKFVWSHKVGTAGAFKGYFQLVVTLGGSGKLNWFFY